MKDFGSILAAWENQGGTPVPPADPVVSGPALPSKAEMERARIDDELDLHGMPADEAGGAVRAFLRESLLEGCRKVLIIHGKGLHSEDGKAVLKETVRQILQKDRHVAAWGEAGRKEGGRGASWVWLSARGK